MATSSMTGGERAAHRPSGADLASLGPSDNSDSGSDSLGAYERQQWLSDSDASGTGEASGNSPQGDAPDILPDHLIDRPRRLRRNDGKALRPQERGAGQETEMSDSIDSIDSAFDAPGSALDNPELLDTTADAADLAQETVSDEQTLPSEDLDGFSVREALPQEPARLAPLRGHRGLQ